jgi:phosphatidate cytidylyltransferase
MLLQFYILGLLILSILFIFSYLKRQKELLSRTITLTALLHIFCLALYGGEFFFTLLIIILLSIAVFEFTSIYNVIGWVAAIIASGTAIFFIPHSNILVYILPIFLFFTFITFILNKNAVSSRIYLFGFCLIILIPCSLGLIGIYKLRPEVIIMLFLLLQFNDGFGFLFGKKFGRQRIFPTISPNKTLEGYFFGLLGLILGVLLMHTEVLPILKGKTLFQDALLISCIFLFGNTGDLLFSVIKRKLGIKNFSSILPGHGGILDRFDSIFFVSPILFLLVKYGII